MKSITKTFIVINIFLMAMFSIGCLDSSKSSKSGQNKEAGIPSGNAASISFTDKNADEDQISGTLYITKADDESSIAEYRIYWGSSTTTKLAGQDMIVGIGVTGGNISYSLDTAVPIGATHLLVFSAEENEGGETLLAVLDIPDAVVKQIQSSTLSEPYNLCIFNNKLYFNGIHSTNGEQIWEYDETTAPHTVTTLEYQLYGSADLVVYNNALYFDGYDSTNGWELWTYDGINPAALAQNINTSASVDSYPESLTVYNNYLYFTAINSNDECLLYKYNGTTLIAVTSASDGVPDNLKAINNKLYINIYSSGFGSENSML
jgi:ELWxxDGT repeat protein